MAIVPPVKVGEPRVLVEPKWGKGMIEQDFRFPDGSIKTFNLWHSPGARTSIMFPLTRDGDVIILRQWRPAAAYLEPEHGIITELPGGNPERGTNPSHEEVAETELREETGYHAREWLPLLPQMAWWEPANFTPRYMPVLGIGCEKVQEPEPDETELIEVQVIPLREWVGMISRGEIRDAKSLAVTFLALLRLGLLELKLP